MRLKDLLTHAISELRSASVANPELDARILLQYATGSDNQLIYLSPDFEFNEEICQNYKLLVARRMAYEPVAKIIGTKDFWQSSFFVNQYTLDPRPDSEVIISAALELLDNKTKSYRFLDIGTGSGCLILSLLQEFTQSTGVASDISPEALQVAKKNAAALGLQNNLTLIQRNWADDITEQFDLIVSNPPYIPSNDIANLAQDVRLHDPMLALDGGEDGLVPYRHLAKQILPLLKQSAYAILEFGDGQSEGVAQIFAQQGFVIKKILTDLSGTQRAIIVKKA